MDSRIESRIQGWLDFYEGKRRDVVLVGSASNHGPAPLPNPENTQARIEHALLSYRGQVNALEWADDDWIPHLSPYTGTEIFAEAFGCRVHRPDNNNPFALPLITGAADLHTLKMPKLENSTLMRIFEIADKLADAEPGAIMRLPDIQSPFDIAALIWEKGDFYASMHEEPSAVKDLVAMTEALLTEFLDKWFARYGKSFVAHFPSYYMPYGITLSEDEVGAISPGMFEEFSLDCLNRLSARYGMIGIHCCADSEHQWALFNKVNHLTLLNFVQPDAVIHKAYKYFRDTCCQFHMGASEFPLDPGIRVVLHGGASDQDGVINACERLRTVSAARAAAHV